MVLWKVSPALTQIDDHRGSQNICLVVLELLDELEAEVHRGSWVLPFIDVGEEGIGDHGRHRVNTDARDQPQGQKSTHCLPVRTVGKRGVAGDHGIVEL